MVFEVIEEEYLKGTWTVSFTDQFSIKLSIWLLPLFKILIATDCIPSRNGAAGETISDIEASFGIGLNSSAPIVGAMVSLSSLSISSEICGNMLHEIIDKHISQALKQECLLPFNKQDIDYEKVNHIFRCFGKGSVPFGLGFEKKILEAFI